MQGRCVQSLGKAKVCAAIPIRVSVVLTSSLVWVPFPLLYDQTVDGVRPITGAPHLSEMLFIHHVNYLFQLSFKMCKLQFAGHNRCHVIGYEILMVLNGR